MTTLARLRPDPVPAIHPLPEYRAEGERKAWYEDMKQVFGVPWMGVVTMAYAHYPTFYRTLWRGVRALCTSTPFVETCLANRAFIEAEIATLDPPPIGERLAEIGYAPREIESIGKVVEVFSHGNQPYVLLATITRYLLEVGDMGGSTHPQDAPVCSERHAPACDVPLVLMEAHHADAPTRGVYEDVMRTLDLPFVNTDYRALARWPSYWALAWGDLRAAIDRREHAALCEVLHARCVEQTEKWLPNPGALSAESLVEAASADAPFEEVRDVCQLFQWLLPGLVTNVAYLRAQLPARDA